MTSEELLTSSAVKSWKAIAERITTFVVEADDAGLQREIVPGKNRVFYLVAHLTAVHDRLFPMLNLGERLHPELDTVYLESPDRAHPDPLSGADLKRAWKEVNEKLTSAFESIATKDWFLKHSAVSEEDFAKDPSRNRFSVLLSRTNHASYHAGQIFLAK